MLCKWLRSPDIFIYSPLCTALTSRLHERVVSCTKYIRRFCVNCALCGFIGDVCMYIYVCMCLHTARIYKCFFTVSASL